MSFPFTYSMRSPTNIHRKPSAQALALSLLFLTGLSSLAAGVDDWLPPVLAEKEVDQRIGELQKRLETAQQDALSSLHYQLGCIYRCYKNDNKNALQQLQKALEADPSNIGALFMLGGVFGMKADSSKSLECSLKICEIDPNHPLAEFAARHVATLFDYVPGYSGKVTPVYEKLLRSNPQAIKEDRLQSLTNIEFQHSFRQTLLGIYRRQGEKAKADAITDQMGGIENWLIMGPFGKFEALSFDETFAPETDDLPRASYSAARGDVHTKKRNFHDEYVSPINKRKRGGAYYAISYINLPKAQDVVLRLRSTSSIELLVNNQLVHRKDRQRDWTAAEELIGISMPAGWNKITVKFTSRITPGNFSILLSDETGNPLNPHQVGQVAFDALPDDAKYPPLNKGEIKTFPVRGTARAYLENLLKEKKSNPWILERLSRAYSYSGDQHAQKEALLKAVELVPNYSVFRYDLGLLYKRDKSLPSKIGDSKAQAEFKRALELSEENFYARHQLALLDESADRDLEALDKLQKCVESAPEAPTWQHDLFRIYKEKNWSNEAEDALARETQLNPDSLRAVNSAFSYFRQKGDFQKYEELTRKVQGFYPEPIYLSQFYEEVGRYEEAIKEYSKYKKLRPNRVTTRRRLVELYRATGQLDKAEAEIKEILAIIPDDPSSLRDLATLYYSQGDEAKAAEQLKKASEIEPSDPRLHRALIFLGEQDVMDDYAIDLSDVLANRPKGADYGNVSSVLLLDQFIVLINKDKSSYERAHIIVKVLNKKGIEKWGEIGDIPGGAEILSLRVVKPDGSISEPELISGKRSISMADLAPGDIVEYEYVVARGKRYSIPNSYSGPTFTFQSIDTPTEHAQLVVITPEDSKLDFFGTRGITENYAELKPKVEKHEVVSHASHNTTSNEAARKTYSVYVWERKGTERILSEPMSVRSHEYLPYVRVAANMSWTDVSLSYQNNLINRLKMSHEMDEALRGVVAGIESEYDKVRAVYKFVNETVKGPQSTLRFSSPAHHILAQKSGNRLLLMKAFLDALGIDSEIILARMITAAQWHWELASPNAFHTALLKVNLKAGKTVWLELSMEKMPFDYVPPFFSNTRGLRVGQKGDDVFIQIPACSVENNLQKSTVTLNVDKEGNAEGEGAESFSGMTAAALRGAFVRMPVYFRKQAIDGFVGRTLRFKAATVKDFKLLNLGDADKPFIIDYNFTVKGLAKKGGKRLTLDKCLTPLDLRRRYVQTPTRKLPLLVSAPNNQISNFTITFPPKSKPKAPSQGLAIGEGTQEPQVDFGAYSLVFSTKENEVRISRKSSIPMMRIRPADYASFADFCAKVDEAERFEITAELGE